MYVGNYSGVIFGYESDWENDPIYPTSTPYIAPPEMKTSYVDIPGANGSLDMSTALTGLPTYKNREGEFEFLLPPLANSVDNRYYERYSSLMHKISQKATKMTITGDPDFYYQGRFQIGSWDSTDVFYKFTVKYNVDPFKYHVKKVSEEFESVFRDIELDSPDTFIDIYPDLIPYADTMPVSPLITTVCTTDVIEIQFTNLEMDIIGLTKKYNTGARIENQFLISNATGINKCKMSAKGKGTISIDYRNGRL